MTARATAEGSVVCDGWRLHEMALTVSTNLLIDAQPTSITRNVGSKAAFQISLYIRKDIHLMHSPIFSD